MSDKKHLTFVYETIIEKIKYRKSDTICPFCNRDELTNIIDEDGSIILLENKFPALADTYQLVLIETDKCTENIATYKKNHLLKIISLGINHWLEMESGGEYKSVVFFKNHGPLSGGSIDHAHMQIVGLKNIDYRENITDEIFEGIEIYREEGCEINISTQPNACSTEFNIITTPRNDNFIADNLPVLVKYLLKQSRSYNLFFYDWKGSIICKVVARWVTSPYLVGYSIPHDSNRISTIAEELRQSYL